MVGPVAPGAGAQIPQFYAGRNLFITGGSGFMGKVLVERLLSTCPDIGKLYLLLRSKKDVQPEKRLEKLKQSQVFDVLRQKDPQQLEKVRVVAGDVEQPSLGISPQDLETLRDVSVVFHSAATLKFDEELHKAVQQNIRSVIYLMEICDALPNIQALVYVSTAYSNPELSVVEERVYPPPAPLEHLLAHPDLRATPELLGAKPNTYTFTKAMAESAVEAHGASSYPISIFRPTIVISSLQHPFPGWLENLNGPSGICVAAGKGLLHVFRAAPAAAADLLPVDIAIDTLIAVAWETAINKSAIVPVYNCTVGSQRTTWREFEQHLRVNVRRHPLDAALWYPCAIVVQSKFALKFYEILCQTIPLHLAQYVLQAIGYKTKLNLITASKMLSNMNDIFVFFSMREWEFRNERVQALHKRLTPQDAAIYNLDPKTINWDYQYEHFVKGTRKYLLKEKDENLPEARQHLRKMRYLHYGLKLLLMFLLIRLCLHSKSARAALQEALRFSASLLLHLGSVFTIHTNTTTTTS